MARLDKDSKRVAELLDGLEKFLQVTKTEHEMYFMGILKRPPEEKAAELVRMFHELENTTITNTALGFRAKVLRTRWNSLRLMWLRTLKQIEEGTYRRQRVMADVRDKEREKQKGAKVDPEIVRAELRALARGQDPVKAVEEAKQRLAAAKAQAVPGAAAKAPPLGSAATAKPGSPSLPGVAGVVPPRTPGLAAPGAAAGAVGTSTPPPPPGSASTPPPAAARPTGAAPSAAPKAPLVPNQPGQSPAMAALLDAATGRQRAVAGATGASATARQPSVAGHSLGSDTLYQEYLAARRQAGESGSGLSADVLRQTLSKQVDAIKGQYGVSDVRFRVVVENGKSKVKAIPVK